MASDAILSKLNAGQTPAGPDLGLEKGDTLLILKKDGEVRPVSIGFELEEIERKLELGERLTPHEEEVIEQGRRVFVLAMAASSPQIMTILYDIASSDDVIDEDRLNQISRPN